MAVPELGLHEEIMLLALREEEGTVHSSASYHFALSAAALAELLLRGVVELDEGTKRRLVTLPKKEAQGDPLLDECIGRLESAKRRASLQDWVWKLSGIKGIKDKVALELCRKGVLRADEDKVLLIFSRKIYPERDPRPEKNIRERMRRAIFGTSASVVPRTAILISLAHSTGLLNTCFDKKKLRARKRRIEQIAAGDRMGKAAKEAIDAAHAALVVTTCIVPMIVAS